MNSKERRNKLELPILMCDFYKTVHAEQYPKDIKKIVSYFTPRMSRIDNKEVILFGLQAFIEEFLIDSFNENFFERDLEEVINEYNRVLSNTLGTNTYDDNKIIKLHELGYLPLKIRALPEGMKVPMKIPCIEISNTHDDFAWLPNAIETALSCNMWHPMISATVGYNYRKIVDKYYDISVDNHIKRERALGDFSMRGQESDKSAIKSSAAFLLSFLNTATVPAITFLEKYYNCDCTKEEVGFGAISTEHSVMCSNYAVDGNEITFIKRLLTEIYPNSSFSMVSDSYDYWNLITNLLPKCKKEIMKHNGTLSIRGDSGDPVDIICGTLSDEDYIVLDGFTEDNIKEYYCKYASKVWGGMEHSHCLNTIRIGDYLYKVTAKFEWVENNTSSYGGYYGDDIVDVEIEKTLITPDMKGTVELLWEIFGGTINNKGYKVLDNHIKAIYGDSITPQRAKMIYEKLIKKGFACNCVTLGVGSFSMQCIEELDNYGHTILKPFTRDTFGIAVKATYGETSNKQFGIFKNPKTDNGNFKKSQNGCCEVHYGECDKDGNYCLEYYDGLNLEESFNNPNNLLKTVFENGEMIKEWSLTDIRKRLYEEEE